MQQQNDDIQTNSIIWDSYIRAGQQALRLKNVQEAERMFALAFERAQTFEATDFRQMETMRLIAKCYMERADFAKAEEFLSPLLEVLYAKFGANSKELLDALRMLAQVQGKQGKFIEATKLLRYVLDNHPNKSNGPLDPELQSIQSEYKTMRSRASSDSYAEIQWLN